MRWLFVIGVLAIFSGSYEESAQDKKQSTDAKQGSSANPLVIKVLPTEEHQQKSAKEEEHESNETRIARGTEELVTETSRLVIVTAALSAFTFALFVATYLLVKDAKETGQKELRAYVGIKPDPNEFPTLDELHTKGLKFIIVNYGQTPAHDVEHVIAMGGFTEDPFFEPMDFSKSGSRFVLFPSATSDLNVRRTTPFQEGDKEAIRIGAIKIYVWGELRYRDVFNKKQRHTFFRLRQDPGTGTLHFTEEGNRAT